MVMGGALSLAWCGPQSKPNAEPQKSRSHTAREIRALLAKPISLDKGLDPKTPLRDVLEFLTDQYGVTILIDAEAFRTEANIEDAENAPIKLARMRDISLGAVLRLIAAQIKGTYLVHHDYIEITTPAHALVEQWSQPNGNRLAALGLAQMVSANFEKFPLEEALRELADRSGINIVVDTRAEDKARTAVTATLSNVPVDTAVEVLADMAGLKLVPIDNVIYVTARPNAQTLHKELMLQRFGDGQ
jgi:hypothetical protein